MFVERLQSTARHASLKRDVRINQNPILYYSRLHANKSGHHTLAGLEEGDEE
jgi:hypothetical protein